MSEDNRLTEQEFHRKAAADLFNAVWDLMDKKERSPDENDRMIHAAHASRFHWGEIGTPLEAARGEWQISRVYALLGRAEPSLHHARRSLEICQSNNIGDFDIAFAHEAMARSLALGGNAAESARHIAAAKAAADAIKEDGNKQYFLSQLATVPGYAQ